MNTKNSTEDVENRMGYWRRVLRPLFWWLLLVAILFAVHQHQLALEHTRIYFSVSMYETNLLTDAVATLDGRPIGDGENISLGSHHLTITQSKAETFSTNFFAWYGRRDFGRVNLTRAIGALNISAEETAKEISVTGPEFETTLYNSTGTNILVPTDSYRVSAQYRRWSDARDFTVSAGNTTRCMFTPQLSALSITTDKSPANFELQDATGNVVERGDLPTLITELPAGHYSVLTKYRNHALKQGIDVLNTRSNQVPFHFAFGAARFESVPFGASIFAANGDNLGTTPVVVTEISPCTADYRLQLDGYDTATVSATVLEDKTNTVNVTLVSLSYLGSMRTAQNDLDAGNYQNALSALEQALAAKPGDTDALNLQTNARCRQLVQEAKDLVVSRSDYVAADLKLRDALAILPDDAEAKKLQAEYQPHETAEMVKMKAWRTRKAFDEACQTNLVAGLFEEQEVTITNMAPEAFRDALIQNCEAVAPTLKVTVNSSAESGIFELFMVQASNNPLVTARRECLMIVGMDKAGQTVALFKLFEYQRKLGFQVNLNRLDSITVGDPNEWIPLNPARIQMTAAFEAQIRDGVRVIKKKIIEASDDGKKSQ